MELIFNELSFRPHLRKGILLKDIFLEMLQYFGELKEKFGLEGLLFPRETFTYKVLAETNFIEWIASLTNTSEKNMLLSFIRTPFSEDILEDEEQEKTHNYYYENPGVDIDQEYCVGLGRVSIPELLKFSTCVTVERNWLKIYIKNCNTTENWN